MDVYKIKFENMIVEYDRLKNNNNILMQRCNNLKTMLKDMRVKRNTLINKLDACGDNYIEFIELHNAQATERLNGLNINSSTTLCTKNNNNQTHNIGIGHLKTQKTSKHQTKNIKNNNLGHIIKALEKNNLNLLDPTNNLIGIIPNEMPKSHNFDNGNQYSCNLKKNEVLRERKIKVKRSKSNKPLKHQLIPYPNSPVAYTPVPISCYNKNILNVNNLGPNAIILTNIQPQPPNNPSYYSIVSQGNVYLLGNSSLHQANLLNMKGDKQNLPVKLPTSVNVALKPLTCSNFINHILPLYTSQSPMIQKNKTISNLIPNMTSTLLPSSILPQPTSKNVQLTFTSKGQYINTQTTTSYLSYNDYLDSLLNKTVVSNLLSDNSNFVTFGKPFPSSNCIKSIGSTQPSKDNAINSASQLSSTLPKVILPKTI